MRTKIRTNTPRTIPPPVINLAARPFQGIMRRIPDGKPGVRTRYRLAYEKSVIRVRVEAEDPCMLDLIATVSDPGTDHVLYEEDCIQLALCTGASAQPEGMLLLNARGSRTGSGSGMQWACRASSSAHGWTLEVDIPLSASTGCLGLSLHRFFRGVKGEIQGIGSNLPHPQIASRFPCLVLKTGRRARQSADAWRKAVTAHEQATENAIVESVSARLKKADQPGVPDNFTTLSRTLAERRFAREINPNESFLCWNEAHFQHAVINLWDITGDRSWLELLIPRIQAVWTLTGEARGAKDAMWGKPTPTWYNDTETGAACTLVSGAILWPITRWMRTVLEIPALSDLAPTARKWIEPACRVLDFHDPEWIDLPDGSGMHLEPYNKGPQRVYPRGGSRINPLNREFFLTLPMIHMAALTGNAEYRRKVTANARYFVSTSDISSRRFEWEYLVGACPADGEDLSHGACQVAFAEQCRMDGIVLTTTHLKKMANSLAELVFRHGDVPAETVRGYYPGLRVAVGAWSRLARFRPEVLPKVRRILKTALVEQDKLFDGSEGWGIRLLTDTVRAEQYLQGKTPCTA